MPPTISFIKIANLTVNIVIKDIEVDFVNTIVFILSSEMEIFKLKFKKVGHDNVEFDGKLERLGKVPSDQKFGFFFYY